MDLQRYHRKLILLNFQIQNHLSKPEFLPNIVLGGLTSSNGRWVYKAGKGNETVYCICDKDGHSGYYSEILVASLEAHLSGGSARSGILKRYDYFCQEFFPGVSKVSQKPISDPGKDLGVFTFGELIGIERPKARFIIDNHYSTEFPTFGTFADTLSETERTVVKHGGVYSMYRLDDNALTRDLGFPFGVLTKSRISIRYPVPFRSFEDSGKTRYRIRCKLNVPAYESLASSKIPEQFFRYDGYVSPKGSGWWQWLFQLRKINHRNSEDLIFLYTQSKDTLCSSVPFRAGKIMFQDQSRDMLPTYANVVIAKHDKYRVSATDISDDLKQFMPGLRRYYEMQPGEREDMRSPSFVDLTRQDTWTEMDRMAVELLFSHDDPAI